MGSSLEVSVPVRVLLKKGCRTVLDLHLRTTYSRGRVYSMIVHFFGD